MISHLIACIAAFPLKEPVTQAREYKAKLGTPYKIGIVGITSGTNDRSELGESRLVTLEKVQTALAYGGKKVTFVAPAGKKLIIFLATIKNPEKGPIYITSDKTFGLRLYDTTYTAKDVSYRGALTKGGDLLDHHLKPGESIEVATVYEFPSVTPHLRVGMYYHTYMPKNAVMFDLTDKIEPPRSVFAKSNMNYVDWVSIDKSKEFDLDDLTFKVLDCQPIKDNGFAVKVQISNPMPMTGNWGWQYAKAIVRDAKGAETSYYPSFTVGPDWNMTIEPGKSVVGEYRFYPADQAPPKTFVLTQNSTKRTVTVTGL
ncbi:MAG: hypothetical protein JST51_06540 [Armatimonadetes bacterium]|nr:hypothetical protein [Armatimonadota bacterium]